MKNSKIISLSTSAIFAILVSASASAGNNVNSACWWDGYLDKAWQIGTCSGKNKTGTFCKGLSNQRKTANSNFASSKGGINKYCKDSINNRGNTSLIKQKQAGAKNANKKLNGRTF